MSSGGSLLTKGWVIRAPILRVTSLNDQNYFFIFPRKWEKKSTFTKTDVCFFNLLDHHHVWRSHDPTCVRLGSARLNSAQLGSTLMIFEIFVIDFPNGSVHYFFLFFPFWLPSSLSHQRSSVRMKFKHFHYKYVNILIFENGEIFFNDMREHKTFDLSTFSVSYEWMMK